MLREDERLIEIYASEPQVLSTEDRIRVEELVQNDHEAAEIFAFFRSYYEDLLSISSKPTPEVAAFVERLFPSQRIINLHAIENASGEGESGNTILDTLRMESGLHKENFATFMSDEENVLLVIQYAVELESGVLQLVTDLPERQAYALVHCPALHLLIVTDEQGRSEVPLFRPPIASTWKGVGISVRFPLASFVLNEGELFPGMQQHLLPSSGRVLTHLKEDQIDIIIEEVPEEKILYAALIDGETRNVSRLKNGLAHFAIDAPRARILVKLY